MMSCRLKAFMVLALCALARSVSSRLMDPNSSNEAGKSEPSSTDEDFINVNALVSIPPSKIGNAQIVSSVMTMSGESPCLFTIIADEQCKRSSNVSGSCKSLNKEPELIVTLVGVVNHGKPFTYRANVTGRALMLTVSMENSLIIVPKYYPEPGNTTVYLNFKFESFRNIDKDSNSSDVIVNVQAMDTPKSPTTITPYTRVNGQSGLRPLNGAILLMLLAVFLFN